MKSKIVIAGAAGFFLITAGTAAFFFGSNVGAATEDESGSPAAQSGPPPADVAVAEIEERSLAPRSEIPGSVVSLRDSFVAAATSGKIEWVAEIGAEVEEGEIIARIDANDAQLSRDDSAAQVRRLASRARYLSSLYERFTSLGDEAGESEASLDEMRSNRDEAIQAKKQAEVALRRAEINLERTEVRAPFAGRVVSQETQIGEFANPGAQLIRLVDTHRLEVTARTPSNLAGNINAGDQITVINGIDRLDATVRAIVPVGDTLSRMLELRLALPETDWYIGSAVRISVPSSQARTVAASPRDALILRADRVSVFVIDSENNAKQVDVELGAAEGDFIEVVGDVTPGDKVVVRGGERLRDGQPVTISSIVREPSV